VCIGEDGSYGRIGAIDGGDGAGEERFPALFLQCVTEGAGDGERSLVAVRAPAAEEFGFAPGAALLAPGANRCFDGRFDRGHVALREGGLQSRKVVAEPRIAAGGRQVAQVLARFIGPLRLPIDREVTLPCGALFVDESQAFEDQTAIEERFGVPRIDRQRAIGGGERLGEHRRLLELQRRDELRGGEITPDRRVASRCFGDATEPLDRLFRFLDQHVRDSGRMLRRRGIVALGVFDHRSRRAAELQPLRLGRRIPAAQRAAIRSPAEAAGQSRLDDARRLRRRGDERFDRRP
jgi:hypothetical protein